MPILRAVLAIAVFVPPISIACTSAVEHPVRGRGPAARAGIDATESGAATEASATAVAEADAPARAPTETSALSETSATHAATERIATTEVNSTLARPNSASETRIAPPTTTAGFETLKRRLDDGVTLCTDLYRAPGEEPKDAPRPVLVCFHATRSSRGEYRLIAPEFVARGFHVLAVDLRYGGPGELGNRKTKERTGTRNETWASAVELLGREPTAIEAYGDFATILAWARELFPKAKLGLVGSSYSAALALIWAAEHPRSIAAVYAFSPGEWIDGWNVAAKSKRLAVPCFLTCGTGGVDVEQAKKIVEALEKPPTCYFPDDEGREGLHGVGTLHMKYDAGRAEMWKRLDLALEWLRPARASTTPGPR